MTADRIEYFGRSLIQHGPSNDRVYLMKLDSTDLPQILTQIHELAAHHGYSKIFAKVPASAASYFHQGGYQTEAIVPNFYHGSEDGLFMVRYYRQDRMIDPLFSQVHEVIEEARRRAESADQTKSAAEQRQTAFEPFECRLALPQDCRQMGQLYRQIFASYPFPIGDPEYLRQTMDEDVMYAGIWHDEKLAALASAEIDRKSANAEMTDFATHPQFRGNGLATFLLQKLENLMQETGIKTCYTIARATSFGMNITFARNRYAYGGTLINNTQISGSLESMNIWHKKF